MPKKEVAKSKKPTAAKAAVSTTVRNSAIPKVTAKKSAVAPVIEITQEMIAVRAYEKHLSGSGGTESDNWFAAERELRGL